MLEAVDETIDADAITETYVRTGRYQRATDGIAGDGLRAAFRRLALEWIERDGAISFTTRWTAFVARAR